MTDTPYEFGEKDPESQNDPFTYDLTAWLSPTEVIDGSPTAGYEPNDSSVTIGTIVASGSFVTVYLSGGTAGMTYTLALHVSARDTVTNSIRGPIAIKANFECVSQVMAQ